MLKFDQLSKDEQIRVLDHRNACEVLCILLMSAENYALGNSTERVFGKFDKYDNVKNKTRLGLKRQLIYEIIVCSQSFKNYIDNYIEFDFPQNLSKKDIQKMVNKWKNQVNFIDQKYYDDIITIINGQKVPDRRAELSQLPIEKTNNNIKKINNMIEYSKYTNDYLDNEEAKVTQEFEKNKTFSYRVEFGLPPGSEIKRIEEIRKNKLEKLKADFLRKEREAKEAKEQYEKEKNRTKKSGLLYSFFY